MNAAREWPSILEFNAEDTITARLVEDRYRRLAKKYHPDAGGSDGAMTQLNLAKQLALKWIEKEQKRIAQLQKLAEDQQRVFNQAQSINREIVQGLDAIFQSYYAQANAAYCWGQGLGSMAQQSNQYPRPSETGPIENADEPPKMSRRERFIGFLKGKFRNGN